MIQENFFKNIDNEIKAYILGFLYADGYFSSMTNKISIQLSEKDSGILREISYILLGEDRTKIRLNNHTSYIDNRLIKGGNIISLQISNKEMIKDLISYGNESPKSLNLQYPPNIGDSVENHFIRGYFDGDGCVCIKSNSKNNVKRATVSILSSLDFCNRIQQKIKDNLHINSRVKQRKNIFSLEISGNKQVEIFLDWIYKDSNIKLDRKYLKYIELKKIRTKTISRLNRTYSKFNNISYDKKRNKWIAYCRIPSLKKTKTIGRYISEEDAFLAQQDFLRKISTLQEH